MEPTISTIDFPIGDIGTGTPTKPIPLTALPNFHGLTSEDPDTFLFEFDIVCRGYDYNEYSEIENLSCYTKRDSPVMVYGSRRKDYLHMG